MQQQVALATRKNEEPHCNKHKGEVIPSRVPCHIPGAAHLLAHTELKCGSAVPLAVLSASMTYTNCQQPITLLKGDHPVEPSRQASKHDSMG